MDKDTLRNLLVAMVVFMTVIYVGQKYMPPPRSPDQTQPVAEGTVPARGEPVAAGPVIPRPPTHSAQPAADGTAVLPADSSFAVIEAESEQTVTIGSAKAEFETDKKQPEDPYRMRLVLSNVGACVESATMTNHRQERRGVDCYKLLSPVERRDLQTGELVGLYRSLGIDRININKDADVSLGDKRWNVRSYETDDGQMVEFQIEIRKGDMPAIRLIRKLELPRQSVASGRHDLLSELTVENLSDSPTEVIISFMGGLGVKLANTRMDDRCIDAGYFQGGLIEGDRKKFADVTKGDALGFTLYGDAMAAEGRTLSWAATANTYFTCTLAPVNPDGTNGAEYIRSVYAIDADGSRLTDGDTNVCFFTKATTIAPQEIRSYPVQIYLGEKNAKAFKTVEQYSSRNYYYQIAQGFGFCTFGVLVELMIWLLNTLFGIVHNFGIAIIILVLIVRTILHPLTKYGQVSMTRMQKGMAELQPKFDELKKKYANDKARMQQEQMKLYRETGSGPAAGLMGCLPMMLQMPIWIALYMSLSNNILMRHEPFFWWIDDLTAPDALYTFSTPIVLPLFGSIPSFNLLPLLLGVAMYSQQKLMPKPTPNPAMSDQQRQQQETMQKMMPMMSILMPLIFYKMPSGLNLYIMCSSAFGTIEQLRIRKHIKEMEENGTLLKPKSGPKPEKKRQTPKTPGWFEKLQSMADDAQKQAAHRKDKGK